MKKKRTNGLYGYLENFYQTHTLNEFAIRKSLNLEHEAFYIEVDHSNQTNFQLANDWIFHEKHLTVERRSYHETTKKMGTHGTLCFKNKKDKHLLCKIHVYLDEQGHFSGAYQIKVLDIRTQPAEVLSVYDYDADEASSDNLTPNHGVALSKKQILEQIVPCQEKLFYLLSLKNKEYCDLSDKIRGINEELAYAMENADRIKSDASYRQAVITIAENFSQLVQTINCYSDYNEYSDAFLIKMIAWLKQCKQEKESQLIAPVNETRSLVSSMNTLGSVSPGPNKIEQSTIKMMINKILLLIGNQDLKDMPALKLLQVVQDLTDINQSFFLYELSYETPEDKKFLIQERSRLSAYPYTSDVAGFFRQRILTGDQSVMSALNECSHIKFDFLSLFEALLEEIESLDDDTELCQKLISTAHHFYNTSDLYKAYVMFRMREYFPLATNYNRLGLLGDLYRRGKLSAFKMYLQQKYPLNDVASSFGVYGFDPMTTIFMLSSENSTDLKPPVLPYIAALLEHNAPIACVHTPLPPFSTHFEGGDSNAKNSKKLSVLGVFNVVKSAKARVVQTRIPRMSEADLKFAKQWSSAKNILELALNMLVPDPELILLIAQYCDLETCLLELVKMIHTYDHVHMMVARNPALNPAISIYPDTEALIKARDEMEALVIEGPPSIRYLFAFSENPAIPNLGPRTECFEKLSLYIHQQLQSKRFSDDDITRGFQNLSKGFIEQRIAKKDLSLASSYCFAAIVAQSSVSALDSKGYKNILSLMWRYTQLNSVGFALGCPTSAYSLGVPDMAQFKVNIVPMLSDSVREALQNDPQYNAIMKDFDAILTPPLVAVESRNESDSHTAVSGYRPN